MLSTSDRRGNISHPGLAGSRMRRHTYKHVTSCGREMSNLPYGTARKTLRVQNSAVRSDLLVRPTPKRFNVHEGQKGQRKLTLQQDTEKGVSSLTRVEEI